MKKIYVYLDGEHKVYLPPYDCVNYSEEYNLLAVDNVKEIRYEGNMLIISYKESPKSKSKSYIGVPIKEILKVTIN